MYQRDFDTIEEKLSVYEKLMNLNSDDWDDLQTAIDLFKAPETAYEKQMKIEFEAKKEESKKLTDILDFMKDVRENGHDIFEVIENSIYVKGIRISTPELLIREITKADSETNNDRASALLNFWKLCALNPDPRARFDLFKFLHNHNLNLTPSGNFVAYRTVNVYKSGDAELEKFVTQSWLQIKRWKKAPSQYFVISDNKSVYSLDKWANNLKGQVVGNLDELYQNIGTVSGNVYTDAHTGTCRIKIGEPVSMPRDNVDPDPTNSCSKGYHVGNQAFMRANMGSFGKVGIVCLVNPRNVTSVPEYDSGKMRTCEYLPIAIAELDEDGHIVDVDVDVFDLEIAQNTQEELAEMASLSSTELEEYKKHEFIAPEIDFKMLDNILNSVVISIDEANKKIKNRVVKL
jgi:hypothetical protein